MEHLSRRRFLQTAITATAATQIAPVLSETPAEAAPAWPENGTLVPDDDWRLWIDAKAEWQNDEIYLPEEISWIGEGATAKLCGKGQPLPVNEPTGGWGTLRKNDGLEVTLPTTVEQHFWGKFGAAPASAGQAGKPRPYTPEEYRYAAPYDVSSRPESHPEQAKRAEGGDPVERPASQAQPQPPADDDIPQNGAYFGVSWWGREIEIPAGMRGNRIFLHIRGARLRAEVYLNKKLVGYSIMEELPFECDLTHAADPGGFNLLAIRLTNPFGRFDWVDGSNARWGKLALYRSHGFAGLDRGMTISPQNSVRIKDAWVLNTQDAQTIALFMEVEGDPQAVAKISNEVLYEIIDPSPHKWMATPHDGTKGEWLKLPEGDNRKILTVRITVPKAQLWDLDNPKLYRMMAALYDIHGAIPATRYLWFGFRSFAPTGTGTNAIFRLNNRRIRLYTAISWGFWGLNGLFPVPELAEKEVVAAKQLGLNCLNFHRNLAKEDVLRAHDRLGLLRYMEPGAGKLAIGKLPAGVATNAAGTVMEKPVTEADHFAQRYMFVKCVEMVKAYRSHPSVIEYCLQNEIGADIKNPATLAILKAMHDEDPSRMVVLNDGFVARGAAQAWYEPWTTDLKEGKLHRSDEEPWGAFWNNHQGAGDQWYDAFYKSPTDYTYKAPFRDILTEFGEMEGCARPDNHPLMVHQIKETYKKYGGAGAKGTSYDLLDHEEIISGYEHFIAKWGFRSAFPTAESLFLALGRTEYESWQNYMENARISDELDFAAISGWESTAIENHSGIVDNLRNFKSDPNLIASSLLPIRPIAKQHSMCVGPGEPFVFDLYLANDTTKPVDGELIFSVVDPENNAFEIGRYKVPNQTPDQFSYLVAEGVKWQPKFNKTVPYFYEGGYTFKFALSSHPSATHTRTLWMTATDLKWNVGMKIALSGVTPEFRKRMAGVEDFKPGETYDVIITSGRTTHTSADQPIGETTGESMPASKPGHVPEPGEAPDTKQLGHIDPAVLEAARAGTPLLVIPQADTLSDGCAAQLAAAGAFTYTGNVGDFRAPWMGNWYFVRKHPLFEGMPVDQAMGNFYQAPGRQSNGLLIEQAPAGPNVEIIVGYSRDHDRKVGAGTFTTRLGKGKLLYHRVPPMHPVLQQRFLANAIRWLTT